MKNEELIYIIEHIQEHGEPPKELALAPLPDRFLGNIEGEILRVDVDKLLEYLYKNISFH